MYHRFDIPEEASWEKVRNTSKDIGEAIQNALRLICTVCHHKVVRITVSIPISLKA